MKTLSCKDLGGPENCEHAVSAETFQELGANCQAHVKEQLAAGDQKHQAAVARMYNASPEEQQKMFAAYQQKWEAAAENN
tara:strand:- start:343 stop:582 length:240 start_codon:yes stop_codon:yes gene_type:complete